MFRLTRKRQPLPGQPGGVRNNYDGPIIYEPKSGQYFDPTAGKNGRYIDLATHTYFDMPSLSSRTLRIFSGAQALQADDTNTSPTRGSIIRKLSPF